MTAAEKIDRAVEMLRQAGHTEVARQLDPVRHERDPPPYQRKQEREGRSEWTGGYAGGRTWPGRER